MRQRIVRTAGHSVIYTAAGVAVSATGLLVLPVFARFLSPADYGIAATAGILTTILAPVMMLGLGEAVTRFYFEHRDDPAALRQYVGSVTWFVVLWAAGLCALLIAAGPLVAQITGIPLLPFVPLAVLAAAGFGLLSVRLALWRARGQPWAYVAAREGLFAAGMLTAVVMVAGFGGGAAGRVWGASLASITGGAMALWLFRHEMWPVRPSWALLAPSLRFGAPLVPHTAFKEAVEFSDRVFLNHFRTLAETGLYSVAYAVAGGFQIVLVGVNAAWGPFVYDAITRLGDDAKPVIARITSYYVAGIVGLALLLALSARELLIVLTAPRFHEAYAVVPIITFAFVLKGLYYMAAAQVFYMRRTRLVLAATIPAGVANLALNWAWIPSHGMFGAAWATLVAYGVSFAITAVISHRLYPIRYEWRAALPLLAALPALAAGYWLDRAELPLGSLLAGKAAVLAAYAGVMLAVFVRPGEVIEGVRAGRALLHIGGTR